LALVAQIAKQFNFSGLARFYNRNLILGLDLEGYDKHCISQYVGCHTSTVVRWVSRGNVNDMVRSGRPVVFDGCIQSKLTWFYCQTRPFDDNGRWTVRVAAAYLNTNPSIIGFPISSSTIHRILSMNNLKPHRSKYFLHISDAHFFEKMEHLINLYNNPPKNFYCYDECPGIQILQRLAPDLRTQETKIQIEEFEYIRHGTTDVLAFFDVNTGKVFAEYSPDHTKDTIVKTFENHFKNSPQDEQLDYIMDNLSAHCCYKLCQLVAQYSNVDCPEENELETMHKRRQWLMQANKRIIFHYTPYHGSWLNQVEYWFGMLQSKCLKETYQSPGAMHGAIKNYVNLWNQVLAKPFKWEYTGEGLHKKVVIRFKEMLDNVTKTNSGFLVKQIILHTNLILNYWDLVDEQSWKSLYDKIQEKRFLIEYVITISEKKNIEPDLISFKELMQTMKEKFKKQLSIAA
jgi:hypothetical protein